MGFLNKVKKSANITNTDTSKKISGETKEEVHHLKSDLKDLKKQMKTEESVVTKNDAFAILHSGPKNQKSFFAEFEKITREGYVLNGIIDTKGLPITPFGFDIKSGKFFFFQNKKFITNQE